MPAHRQSQPNPKLQGPKGGWPDHGVPRSCRALCGMSGMRVSKPPPNPVKPHNPPQTTKPLANTGDSLHRNLAHSPIPTLYNRRSPTNTTSQAFAEDPPKPHPGLYTSPTLTTLPSGFYDQKYRGGSPLSETKHRIPIRDEA